MGLCSSCDAGTSLGGARKLAAQLQAFGGFCPILKCAEEKSVAYCPRDCALFPCDEFADSGYPFSRAHLEKRARDARHIQIRPERALPGDVWERLNSLEPERVVEKSGAVLERGAYLLEFLGVGFRVDPAAKKVERKGGAVPDLVDVKGVVYYLAHLPGGQLLGAPVTPPELNRGVNFFKGRYLLNTRAVEEAFPSNPKGFLKAGEMLGGVSTHKGDGSFRIMLLPRVPVELILWSADEDFPARLTLILDRSVENHLPLDLLSDLLNVLLDRVAAWAG